MFSLIVAGCSDSDTAVTLYTSVDDPIARPIVQEFEKQTGIKVTLVTDAEASKTVGLAERLRAEKSNPQCDVWWGNEPFHTINLANEGVLEQYESDAADDLPARFKDPEGRWASVGIRLRVLGLANTDEDLITNLKSIEELTKPEFFGRLVIARPAAGTTGGHVAALYTLWGDEKADAYFKSLLENDILIVGGNSIVAETVGKGQRQIGFTDNDDVEAIRGQGLTLRQLIPDQATFGTLAVPTTVAMIKGAPHADAAEKLVDFLLSREVEQKLIDAKFAFASARDSGIKTMDVDYAAVAKKLPDGVQRAVKILDRR